MPAYKRPSLPVSASYKDLPGQGAKTGKSADEIRWKDFFHDPQLQKLIAIALNNNRDLRVAATNVLLTRAQYNIGQSHTIPTINGTASGIRQRDLSSEDDLTTTGKYSLKAGITSYELDLFGHLRSLKKQALENYFASEEARRGTQIALIAQVAIEYLTRRSLSEQLAQTEQTLKSWEENYDLLKRSYDIGVISKLDLALAETQLQTARVNAATYKRLAAQSENALVVLLGEPLPPDLPQAPDFVSENILADIAPGIPSELLERRPDILEAEHVLKSTNANVGVARAAFFPQITLTAAGGDASVKLVDLFSGKTVWNFSPQITVPIFDAGANKAGLDIAKAQRDIATARYEKTIQNAFREVSDALIARKTLDEQVAAQEELVKTQQERSHLAEVRYRNGIDSYLNVLTAQNEFYAARQNLIQAQMSRYANLITLYKALGGGWDKPEVAAKQIKKSSQK